MIKGNSMYWSPLYSTKFKWKSFFSVYCCCYMTKVRSFVSPSLLRCTDQKYMAHRTQSMDGIWTFLKFTFSWMNICLRIICFFFVPLWCKISVWKLLKSSLYWFPFQVAKLSSTLKWWTHVCLPISSTKYYKDVTQVLQTR